LNARVCSLGEEGSLVVTPKKSEISESEVEQRVFTSLGLSEQEWGVYTFLCKTGPLKANDIARNLGTNRVLIYVYLKNLQRKGLVEATLEIPQKFLAISPKKMMKFCIQNKKDELREIVKDRTLISKILSCKAEPFIPEERVALLQGVSRVFPRIRRMVNECISEFLWMSPTRQSESLQWESVERFMEIASNNPKIAIRIIVNSCSNMPEFARTMEISKNYNLKLELRQATFGNTLRPSEFVIRDRKEGYFTLSNRHTHIKKEEETGLWTNNKSLIETLVFLFDRVWSTSSPCPE
jgi:sugar-specific transcriptional regulator TrmB